MQVFYCILFFNRKKITIKFDKILSPQLCTNKLSTLVKYIICSSSIIFDIFQHGVLRYGDFKAHTKGLFLCKS